VRAKKREKKRVRGTHKTGNSKIILKEIGKGKNSSIIHI